MKTTPVETTTRGACEIPPRLQDTGMVTLSVDVPAGSSIVFLAETNRLLVLAPETLPGAVRAQLAICEPFVVPILSAGSSS